MPTLKAIQIAAQKFSEKIKEKKIRNTIKSKKFLRETLIPAIEQTNIAKIEFYIQHGLNVFEVADYRKLPQHLKIFPSLADEKSLSKGPSEYILKNQKIGLLCLSCFVGNKEVVRYLLDRTDPIDPISGNIAEDWLPKSEYDYRISCFPAIFVAIMRNDIEMINILAEKPAITVLRSNGKKISSNILQKRFNMESVLSFAASKKAVTMETIETVLAHLYRHLPEKELEKCINWRYRQFVGLIKNPHPYQRLVTSKTVYNCDDMYLDGSEVEYKINDINFVDEDGKQNTLLDIAKKVTPEKGMMNFLWGLNKKSDDNQLRTLRESPIMDPHLAGTISDYLGSKFKH